MRKMTRDCFKRMQDEQKELAGRIEKLGNFIHQDMNDHSSFDERTIVMPQADMLYSRALRTEQRFNRGNFYE